MGTTDVLIFDTTLRDGEQAPGNSLTPEEKLRLARQLDALGVDIIEAGFPAASEGDYRSVREIAAEVRRPVIAALARCTEGDIDLAGEALSAAERGRIHVFVSTSDLHMREKLRLTRDEVVERARAAVRRARQFTDDVEFSCEDASRTDPDFLCRVVQAAIEEGATTINLPDTVGYAMPAEYGAMFRDVLARVPGADRVTLSAHCHDDLGLAVANSLAAIAAGARQVECTVNGIGERAGNAALEEIVIAAQVRGAALQFRCNVEPREIYRTSQLLSLPHRRLPPAQQGHRRPQRVRPRGGHPPARHAPERADLRDHPARDGGHPALDPGPRQALGPARAGAALPRAGLRPGRGAAQRGLPGVHRPRGPQARDPRRGPARAAARQLPRRARGVPDDATCGSSAAA